MDPGILLVDAVLAAFCLLLPFLARRQRAVRLKTWRALSALAVEANLSLRPSPTSADGMPEAIGTIGDRPVSVRGSSAGKYTPNRIILALGHRIPVTGSVWIGGAVAARLGMGLPGWTKRWVGDGPRESQALVAARRASSVEGFLALAGPPGLEVLLGWVGRPGFFVAALKDDQFFLQFDEAKLEPGGIAPLLREMGGFVSALEVARDPSGLAPPFSGFRPRRAGAIAGKITLGVMVVVLGMAGFLLWTASSVTDIDGVLLIGGLGVMLVVMACSAIWTMVLGAEEQAILEKQDRRGDRARPVDTT